MDVESICRVIRVALLAVVLAPCACAADDPLADSDTAVEAGREAIDNWIDYPWYDDSTDSVAAIDVKPTTTWTWWPWLAEVLYWGAWFALALVIGLLLYFLIRVFLDRERQLVRVSHADEQSAILAADRVEALPFRLDLKGRPGDLLAEAQRQYAAGNYDQAIIYLYSFELVELDKGHVIHLTRGKTNRQYLRETRLRSQLGDLLQRTMVAFEDVFFGKHSLSRLRFDQCWSDVDEFQSQLRRETNV